MHCGALQARHAVLSIASGTRAQTANELGHETWKTLSWTQVPCVKDVLCAVSLYAGEGNRADTWSSWTAPHCHRRVAPNDGAAPGDDVPG